MFHTAEAIAAEVDYRRERIAAIYQPMSSAQRHQRHDRRRRWRHMRHAFAPQSDFVPGLTHPRLLHEADKIRPLDVTVEECPAVAPRDGSRLCAVRPARAGRSASARPSTQHRGDRTRAAATDLGRVRASAGQAHWSLSNEEAVPSAAATRCATGSR
jgi:hypothetical protein